MAYCPECLTEYREGATECIDCHGPLRQGLPPAVEKPGFDADAKLVAVRTFRGPTASMEAELARNVLKEEGILSALPGDTGAEVIPGIDLVHLLVREEDAARAEQILEAFENANAELLESDAPESPEGRGPDSQS